MQTHYLNILIFGLSAALLIFAIMLWSSRPKIDSSEKKQPKKSKKKKEQRPGEPNSSAGNDNR